MTNMIFLEVVTNSTVLCRSESNFDSENEDTEMVGEDDIMASQELDKETRTSTGRKRRKTASSETETDLAAVLARSLKTRNEKEESENNDPDRHFLLSLLDDFHQIPSSKKNQVKISFLNTIAGALALQSPMTPQFTPTSVNTSYYGHSRPLSPAVSHGSTFSHSPFIPGHSFNPSPGHSSYPLSPDPSSNPLSPGHLSNPLSPGHSLNPLSPGQFPTTSFSSSTSNDYSRPTSSQINSNPGCSYTPKYSG